MVRLNQLLLDSAPGEPAQPLESAFQCKISGQDEAIWQLVGAFEGFLRTANRPDSPVRNFLIMGLTGTGTTPVMKLAVERLAGNAGAVLRFDCADLEDRQRMVKGTLPCRPILEQIGALRVPPADTECDLDSELTPWLQDA